MSQYKIRSRPFNDERLPYSGRSLAANRKPNQSDWDSNQKIRALPLPGLKVIRSLRTPERGMLAQMNGRRCTLVFTERQIVCFMPEC